MIAVTPLMVINNPLQMKIKKREKTKSKSTKSSAFQLSSPTSLELGSTEASKHLNRPQKT